MKDRVIKGMAGIAGGMLPAVLSLAPGAAKVSAVPPSPSTAKVSTLPQDAGAGINWTVITIVGILALAIIVAVVVLLVVRRGGSRKRPANLGMPPTMPPPAQLATPSPYAAGTPQQPAQPGAAPAARLVLPDSSEIPLTGGLKPIGRADFERLLPPDSSKYVSREHLVIGFAYGNYYVQDAGSANGTKLNGREIKGAGSQWLRDGDQLNLAGVITVVFRAA